MKNFERWKAAYLGMDDRRRHEHLEMAEGAALDHPAPRPALLLVANNSRAQDTGHGTCSTEDRVLTSFIRAVE